MNDTNKTDLSTAFGCKLTPQHPTYNPRMPHRSDCDRHRYKDLEGIDVEAEHELIQAKKSKLSVRLRLLVEELYKIRAKRRRS
jgi:hypothetical protein